MPHEQHRAARTGPPRRLQDLVATRTRRDSIDELVAAPERIRSLAGAPRRARDDAAAVGQPAFQPLRDLLRLPATLRRQPALEVGCAVLGFGVPPQDQVHRILLAHRPLPYARAAASRVPVTPALRRAAAR